MLIPQISVHPEQLLKKLLIHIPFGNNAYIHGCFLSHGTPSYHHQSSMLVYQKKHPRARKTIHHPFLVPLVIIINHLYIFIPPMFRIFPQQKPSSSFGGYPMDLEPPPCFGTRDLAPWILGGQRGEGEGAVSHDGSVHGAAKKMVLHGSHQYTPNVNV